LFIYFTYVLANAQTRLSKLGAWKHGNCDIQKKEEQGSNVLTT